MFFVLRWVSGARTHHLSGMLGSELPPQLPLGPENLPILLRTMGSLRCDKCAKSCVSPRERHLYRSFPQRRENRMPCCGVDVHSTCKKSIRQCPGCGELLNQRGQPIEADQNSFVYRRREMRRNNSKRRQL